MSNCPSSEGEGGFTLIEVLVALTLTASLGAFMLLGYETVAPAWRRIEARADAGRQFQMAQDFLRDRLSQAYPAVIGEPGHRTVDFAGGPNVVDFIAPLSMRFGATMLVRYRLYADETRSMHVSWQWEGDRGESAPDRRDSATLGRFSDVAFAYFGADEPLGRPYWHDEWIRQRTLPQLIRIRLKKPTERAPDVVVAPLVTADADCMFDVIDGKCRAS